MRVREASQLMRKHVILYNKTILDDKRKYDGKIRIETSEEKK